MSNPDLIASLRALIAEWRAPSWDEGMLDRRVYIACADELERLLSEHEG